MKLITAIHNLERWRPIMEWDDHIKELPDELEESWNRILQARDMSLMDRLGLTQTEIREITELINNDVLPTEAFRRYGIKYAKSLAKRLGMEDVVDSYYRRVKSYYLIDPVTKEKYRFYRLQDVAEFLGRKDYRSLLQYIDRALFIPRTNYKIYKYRTFKKRKRF